MKVSVAGNDIFVGQGGVAWRTGSNDGPNDGPSHGPDTAQSDGQRTLVLQHGAGMDRTVWVLLARYFARHGFNVVSADLPAHGASGGTMLGTIEEQAAHLWQLLDVLYTEHALSLDQCVLAGHSMGALVVLEAARMRPHCVEQLILVGAGYPMPVGGALLDAAQANDQAAVDMIALFSHSFGSQLGHNAMAGINVQNMAMALLERARPDVLFTDLQACNNYQGAEDAAKVIDGVSCTVISGLDDRMTPIRAADNVARLLGARQLKIANCGHMLMSEQPEATLQAFRQCLQ